MNYFCLEFGHHLQTKICSKSHEMPTYAQELASIGNFLKIFVSENPSPSLGE
jgi:hypothetical protein